jgi:hypothetical protein
MGLRLESIHLLLEQGKNFPFYKKKLLVLGKQDVYLTYPSLEKLAKKLSYSLQRPHLIELSLKPHLKVQGFISDKTLFQALGFQSMQSLDASLYEGADLQFDLNQPTLPNKLKEEFDLVLDPGTLEHVFHLPHSLHNIFQALKVGGRVIHIAPSSNHFDHGFYMFSPTLFADYYKANFCPIQALKIIRYDSCSKKPWKITPYTPESFAPFSFGGLDDHMYAILCVATKTKDSTSLVIPQQHLFAGHLWNRPNVKASSLLKQLICRLSPLYRLVARLRKKWMHVQLSCKFRTKIE